MQAAKYNSESYLLDCTLPKSGAKLSMRIDGIDADKIRYDCEVDIDKKEMYNWLELGRQGWRLVKYESMLSH